MKVKNQMFTHRNMHKNLSVPSLIKKALLRKKSTLTDKAALRFETKKYTGRSPKDRFIVKDDISDEHVDWGKVNQPFEEEKFNQLYEKMIEFLLRQDEVFSFQGFAGADEDFRLPIRVINEYAWHNLLDRESTRLNSSHVAISYAVFC